MHHFLILRYEEKLKNSTSKGPNIPERKLSLVYTLSLLPLCQKSAPFESRGVGQQGVRHTEPL